MRSTVSKEDYARLLAWRVGFRRFTKWSEIQVRRAGITPAQHQLLLTIKGHEDVRGPSIGEVAEYLLLRHHSVVGLVDRAYSAGLVQRSSDPVDHRIVRLKLTPAGEKVLGQLSSLVREELERVGPQFNRLWKGLDGATDDRRDGQSGSRVAQRAIRR